MGLFDKLKGVFGGKKEEPEADADKNSQTSQRKRGFSLSTGQVQRPAPSASGRMMAPLPEEDALRDTETLPPPEPETSAAGETLPFDLELPPVPSGGPSSLEDTVELSGEPTRPLATPAVPTPKAVGATPRTTPLAVGKAAPNVTARMVAVGKATPEEAADSRQAASPSLRATIAGAAVSHKRRVSAKNKMLGALLVADRVLDEEKLDQLLADQQRNGGLLGQIVAASAGVQAEAVGDALKKQRTITTVTLSKAVIDMDIVKVLDKEFCLKHRLLPFERFGNLLCLAMTNVLDTAAKTQVRERSNMLIKPFDAEWADLAAAIERAYARPGEKEGGRRATASLTARIEAGAVSEALAAAETVGSTEMFAKVATKPLPRQPLAVLPMGQAFAAEVVQWDAADPERRWMATQLADNRLPLLPPMDGVS